MNVKKISLVFFFLLLSFLNETLAKIENKIVVKIDNQIITSYDVKNKIITTLILTKKEISQKNVNDLKSQVLDSLIQSKLKQIELSKFNYEDNLSQINSYLNSISSNNIDQLKNDFKLNNADFEIFLEEVKNEAKWRKLIYNKYAKKIEIDPIIIDKEIKKIIETKLDVIEYNLSEIEVILNNNELDKNKIKLVKEEIIKSGFENSVMKFSISSTASENGKIGWINANTLSKQILNVVKQMKIGEVSEPIKRQNSVLFIKINDKKKSKSSDVNIVELKNNLINQKKNELFLLYSRSDLSKLRNTKFIEYYK